MIDPTDPEEIQGLVLGDHFDVLGYFDRSVFKVDPRTGEEKQIEQIAGILHSRSQFRDDQFFLLIRRIADALEPALAK